MWLRLALDRLRDEDRGADHENDVHDRIHREERGGLHERLRTEIAPDQVELGATADNPQEPPEPVLVARVFPPGHECRDRPEEENDRADSDSPRRIAHDRPKRKAKGGASEAGLVDPVPPGLTMLEGKVDHDPDAHAGTDDDGVHRSLDDHPDEKDQVQGSPDDPGCPLGMALAPLDRADVGDERTEEKGPGSHGQQEFERHRRPP